jgi:hypothetical protein
MVNGSEHHNLVSVDAETGDVVSEYTNLIAFGIYALARNKDDFFFGGDSVYVNLAYQQCGCFQTGSSNPTAWKPYAEGGPVDQFALSADGSIYVAGEFTTIGDDHRPFLAAFNRSGPAMFELPAPDNPTLITFTCDRDQTYVVQGTSDFQTWSSVATNSGRFSVYSSPTNSYQFFRAIKQ